MLTKVQANRIFKEEMSYEEKMFKNLFAVTAEELGNVKTLSDADRAAIAKLLKRMVVDTEKHEEMIGELVEYVNKSDKNDF